MSPTFLPKVGKEGVPLGPQTLGGSVHGSACEANRVAGDVVVGTQQPETSFPDKLRKGQPNDWESVAQETTSALSHFSFLLSSSLLLFC